jgi:glycosyltransferase involved in cell wall biosynthesis
MAASAEPPLKARPPIVSVGLPVYNGRRYIEAAIESIIAQTFGDWELIIADDASTDQTPEICRRYASHDSRIRFHSNDTRLGLSANHNRVFELASAAYFHWMGADDMHHRCFLEYCVAALEANPGYALAHTQVRAIDSSGSEIAVRDNALAGTRSSWPADRLAAVLNGDPCCNVMYGVFRRRLLWRSSLMRPFHNSDRVLMAEIALLGPFLHIQEPLYYNRSHSERYSERMERWNPKHHGNTSSGKLHFQHWRSWVEYIRAVRRFVADSKERWACFGQIACCAFRARHMRWLVWDVGNSISPWLTTQGHKFVKSFFRPAKR